MGYARGLGSPRSRGVPLSPPSVGSIGACTDGPLNTGPPGQSPGGPPFGRVPRTYGAMVPGV